MALRPAFIAIAEMLQEAAAKMCHDDIRTRVSDGLRDATKGTGSYCYVAAIFGDAKSGDVVYSCGYEGGLKKASYTISGANCTVDVAAAVDVQPLTTYEVETKLTEAGARNSSRDLRQLQAIHDASMSLGAACKIKEANVSRGTNGESSVALKESIGFPVDVQLSEAFGGDFKTSYNICLIKPGKGSSAFYPSEVLKRDGPKVFKAGTPMRIDHPTRAEEAARPEGSVKDWGAVLESDAVWNETGSQGPALYGTVKPFSDHVQLIHEKGPYAGVSIRANGEAVMESGKPKMRDGVPVLAELTSAEGVDMVTRAGAGGMFLSESAIVDPANKEGQATMSDEEIKKLVESSITAAVSAATAPLRERAMKGDATIAGLRALKDVSFTDAQKQFVVEQVLRETLPTKDGVLDETKFSELVIAEAKRVGVLLGNGAAVRGLGVPVREAGTKACTVCDGEGGDCESCDGTGKMRSKESRRADQPDPDKELAGILSGALGLSESAAARAAKGRE